MPRFVIIVMDSAGVGALPDAADYGDAPGANTIGNIAAALGGLHLPHFERLGLGNLCPIRGVAPIETPAALVARLRERSKGKDTVTGHWEMAGLITPIAFPTYPQGFPPEVLTAFESITGKRVLGNKAASGTEIIQELGPQHEETGRPILYTSADSVFQVAAHEAIVPLATLYAWCEAARAVLVAPNQVNRVIARPFIGTPGAYERTPNRRDYPIEPAKTILDRLSARGVPVHAVGKISDIYCGHGISTTVRVVDNRDAMERTFELLDRTKHGLIFVNLNDFDSKYGHRRNVRGYGDALGALDAMIPRLLSALHPGDRVIFTADHGCDPTALGTDHTREYVPYIDIGADSGDLGIIDGLEIVGRVAEEVLTHPTTVKIAP